MLRIALVAPDCNQRDGQARYVWELAAHLALEGHAVEVFAVRMQAGAPAGVRHHPVAAPAAATRRRFFTFLPRATRAIRRAGRFDLIHSLGASCLAPDVVTMQFCQAAWDEVAIRTGGAGGLVDRAVRRAIAAVEEAILRRDRVISVVGTSRRVVADLTRLYGRSRDLFVAPNGVDAERFHPRLRAGRDQILAAAGIPTSAFCALFLGEFARKNLTTAIAALARTRDRRIHLLAVGGPQPEVYRAQAVRCGVARRLHLEPRTDRPERVLAAADALVFPTLYEPFGMVGLEAAAVATPVITSATCGFAEWLTDGIDGLVTGDPMDAAALAGALDRLAADPELSRRLGAAGRQLAERLTWERVATATWPAYQRALERTGSDGRRPQRMRQRPSPR